MLLDYPKNVTWYIEARNYHPVTRYAPVEVASAGTAVAVKLRWVDAAGKVQVSNFLLTCGHVVRRQAVACKKGAGCKGCVDCTGWGAKYDEICCFRPGSPYLATKADTRKAGDTPDTAFLASLHPSSPLEGTAQEVSLDDRHPQNDWMLLAVQGDDFQHFPAIHLWHGEEPFANLELIGYPGGAVEWEHGLDLVESVASQFAQTRRSSKPGMLRLDGTDSSFGMSGGGLFLQGTHQLVALHRAATRLALSGHSITLKHILTHLAARGLAPAIEEKVKPLPPGPDHRPGASPADPCDALLVGKWANIPFISRPPLREHLRKLRALGDTHIAFSVLGPRHSGKSHSYELIMHVAKAAGLACVRLNFRQIPSLEIACEEIATGFGLDVEKMHASAFKDEPTPTASGQKFARWLIAAIKDKHAALEDKQKPTTRCILFLDEFIQPNGEKHPVYQDLASPLITRLQLGNSRDLLLPILVGDPFPSSRDSAAHLIEENVEPLTDRHVADHIHAMAHAYGGSLTQQQHLQLLLKITNGVIGSFTPEQMESVNKAVAQVLTPSMLDTP